MSRISLRPRTTGLAVALAALLSLAGAATAGATITKTSVTTPGNPFFAPAWNSDSGATNPNFTIAGTSDGTTGDAVDVICVYGGTSYYTFASSVAVNADGTWSTSTNASSTEDSDCVIRAIPHGSLPADQSPFSGPFSTWSYFYDYTLPSGLNSGQQYDSFTDMWGLHGHAESYSSGDTGLEDQYPVAPDGQAGSEGWYSSAYLPSYDNNSVPRASIQVDGQDAFNSYGAESLWSANPNYSYNNPNLPALSFNMSVDPASGANTSNEGEGLATCPSAATYPYTQSNCASFSDAHVHFSRSVNQPAQGELQYITDTLTSTDGQSHTVNLRYAQAFYGSNSTQFAFPGDGGLSQYNNHDVRTGPFPVPGTVQASSYYYYPTSAQYPSGSLTWDTAPTDARFGSAYSFILDYLNRTVPASGSLTLRFAYVTASNDADNAALTGQAQTAFTPPPPAPPAPPAKPAATPTPPAPPLNPRKCHVPKIARGTKLSVAENKIENAECIVGRITKVHSVKVKKGRVVSQTVAAGTAVPFGSPVGLKVSSGPSTHAKKK